MYTEDTVLDYGGYKNTRIKDLPSIYMINVYRSGGKEHEKLIEYIQANIEKFPILALYAKKGGKAIVTFKCDKRTFPTKKDAMESIVKPPTKTRNKPIPIRAYECPICSGYHLTSKPDRRFQNEESPE